MAPDYHLARLMAQWPAHPTRTLIAAGGETRGARSGMRH